MNMKTMKYLSMLLMMVALSMSMAGCGDDDDAMPAGDEINDFFIEYTVTGGGLNQAQLNSVKTQVMSEYGSYFDKMTTNEAIYEFKELVEEIRKDFSRGVTVGGAAINGTMDITMVLKTKDGKAIKKGIVHVTKDGSSFEV